MYLKKINLNGFKSFAEKCEIDFKPGITAIVGPNGAGKSNIVDAIRWVLGESSAKSLRTSTSISDVIFTGSKTKEPKTRASVALTFDNTDKYLNTEFSEIEIKRTIYADGENEYLINGAKVRLKDITNLFIDSGASKESFNIISQGSITDVITSKPEERRAMIESAAGVLKYKKRKEESLRKLGSTKENMERIDLLLNELELTIGPLKEQSVVATKYLEFKKELADTEISLIVHEIANFNEIFNEKKESITKLNEEIANMDISFNKDSSEMEKIKLNIIKLDEKISKSNETLFKLTGNIADLDSEKRVATERKKFEVDDAALHNTMVFLKEEELSLKKNLDTLTTEIKILNNNIIKNQKLEDEKTTELNNLLKFKTSSDGKIALLGKNILETKDKINLLEEQIESDATLPYAVKSVLSNPKLSGVHSIIGKIIKMEENVSLAIETSLGYSSNIIITDDESVAKECINYLNVNRLGRATFFPLNIIKPKYVDKDIIERIKQVDGFIDIAANLVEFDPKYESIIKNQLGNVLVVKNIDALNLIARITEYRYKIVSLTGEILHTGGSITGGSKKNTTGVINQEFELNKLKKILKDNQNDLKETEKSHNKLLEEIKLVEVAVYEKNKTSAYLTETLNRKNISQNDLNNLFKAKASELKGTKNTLNKALDKDINKILENYYNKVSEKEVLEKNLNALKEEKSTLSDKLEEIENLSKKTNTEYSKLQNDLKELEIEFSKADILLDSHLGVLSENYNMTFEKAKNSYALSIPVIEAKDIVSNLKRQIKSMGDVNTGSISEYERLNKRYTFLLNQKEDINASIDNLLTIITEMDEIMQERFTKTFNNIKKEFAIVFKTLFKGGEGILKLTDPDNILETGIEIIAMPPGKKLNSITLLSGGEKSLTAIALLFAIINVFPVPFCILDEIEAALDDVNVETFGKYLEQKKTTSQFIIITHKKKTMEYADSLYGITMPESGTSKLVSVELEKAK